MATNAPDLLRNFATILERDAREKVRPLWKRKDVADYLACDLKKLDEYRLDAAFPKPLRLNGEARMLRWHPHEVEAWVEAQPRSSY